MCSSEKNSKALTKKTKTFHRRSEKFDKSEPKYICRQDLVWLKNIAIEESINAIAFSDIQGNLIYVNNSFVKLWGYDSSHQIIGKSAVQFWADIDEAEKTKETVRKTGSWIGELKAKKKDNSRFDVQLSANLIKNEKGKPIYMMGSFVDITKLRKAEQDRDQYRIMVESSHDGIFFKDLRSRYIIANNKILEAFGLKRKKIIGKNDLEIMPDKAEARKNIENDRFVFETGQVKEFTKCMTDVKGKKRWFQTIKLPHFDDKGKIVGLVGIALDMTEQTKAQKALMESEQRYRSLVENIGIGVSLISPKMEILALNKQMKRWFPNIDVSRRPVCYKSFNRPPKKHICSYCPTYKSLKDGKVHESVTETPTGDKVINYRIISSPIKDENGNVVAAIEMVEDITEKKQAEQELKEARNDLEIRVEQRTADLARVNAELRNEIIERKKTEQKLLISQKQLRSLASELSLSEERLRRRLATSVHDNIGQNLAISRLKLESLCQSLYTPKLKKSLGEICELIGKSIASSRTLTFELSPPVLYELGFEAAVKWLVSQTRRQHGIIAVFRDDEKRKPLADNVRILLFQAVRELLVNVAKHARAKKVEVSIKRLDGKIKVTVRDNGIGFDASKERVENRKTTGFGLFSIRERLGHIGGRFSVETKPGKGTCITLIAPLKENGKKHQKRK